MTTNPVVPDASPLGKPVVFTPQQRQYLQEFLFEYRTGAEVQTYPQQNLYLVNALAKVEADVTGAPAAFTENENRLMQSLLRNQMSNFEAHWRMTEFDLNEQIINLLDQAITPPGE